MRTKNLFLKSMVLATAVSIALLTGCGGGSGGVGNNGGNSSSGNSSGSSGGSSNLGRFPNVTVQPTGVWSGNLGSTSGDVFDMHMVVNNSSITGTGRITEKGGANISTGQIAGNYTGSSTSGQIKTTVSFSNGSHAGQTFTYTGSLNQTSLSGNYVLGSQSGALSMSKIVDQNYGNVAGTWKASAATADGQTVPLSLTFFFTQSGDQIGGTLDLALSGQGIGSGPLLGGTILGNKITFATNNGETAIATLPISQNPTTMTLTINNSGSITTANLTKQ